MADSDELLSARVVRLAKSFDENTDAIGLLIGKGRRLKSLLQNHETSAETISTLKLLHEQVDELSGQVCPAWSSIVADVDV